MGAGLFTLVRRLLRLAGTAVAVVLGAAVIRLGLFVDRLRHRPRFDGLAWRAQRAWCQGLCRLLGVRIEVDGAALAPAPVLIAANHISWLDIVVVCTRWPVAFLSKSEIASWPLVGPIATGLGTVYIHRGQRGAAERALETMSERLRAGDRVLFFPEGTTGDGRDLRVFRPRLFEAAVHAPADVQPLAIRYSLPDGSYCPEAAFREGQTLLSNLWAVAGVPALIVRLELVPVIATGEQGRSALASRSRAALAARFATAPDDPPRR